MLEFTLSSNDTRPCLACERPLSSSDRRLHLQGVADGGDHRDKSSANAAPQEHALIALHIIEDRLCKKDGLH